MMDDDDNDELPPPKVTDAPAAIWLVYGDIERDCTHWECARNGDVGWCEDKQFDSDVEYVRADTIEAQAERIRVLREALEKLTACKAVEIRLRQLHEMGHGTDYDQHRQQFADAWVKARAALEATK